MMWRRQRVNVMRRRRRNHRMLDDDRYGNRDRLSRSAKSRRDRLIGFHTTARREEKPVVLGIRQMGRQKLGRDRLRIAQSKYMIRNADEINEKQKKIYRERKHGARTEFI